MIKDKQGYPIVNFRVDQKEYELYKKISEEFYKNGSLQQNSIGSFARFCTRAITNEYLEQWRKGVADAMEKQQNGRSS
jgi:arginyl-tRNA--protein-N-Asp/Glu arginylyltransferase